ncbi:hypothetical protein CC1G_06048 [Coprinopsis cinerea okayama7|uniref:Uncharacterized protein n=1 Tax=Coprinopsis cinerea (strain Okayama-7 / 130 / ATCC MYA-4618 / FGSC 9003) TaxID=240176 RepID=A8N4H1_COPC7|nr:hypothetical protein CC1G_06048 [Coprinopsis cinerea okayama7\|eukprot:XP_001829839.2 hypothetical protein CC1G_06048 [Coprinopsis cinerea okayama7\
MSLTHPTERSPNESISPLARTENRCKPWTVEVASDKGVGIETCAGNSLWFSEETSAGLESRMENGGRRLCLTPPIDERNSTESPSAPPRCEAEYQQQHNASNRHPLLPSGHSLTRSLPLDSKTTEDGFAYEVDDGDAAQQRVTLENLLSPSFNATIVVGVFGCVD